MHMGKLERITFTIPEELAAKLRAAVESGAYATNSEIVREAVRNWSEKQERKDAENAAIRELLDAARAGGRRSAESVLERALERIEAVAQNRSEHAE